MRSGYLGSTSSTLTRTGTRCVTFTQLPVAFCGGSSENAEPLPALTLSTTPSNGCFGYLASTQYSSLLTIENSGVPGVTVLPGRRERLATRPAVGATTLVCSRSRRAC